MPDLLRIYGKRGCIPQAVCNRIMSYFEYVNAVAGKSDKRGSMSR